MKTALLTIALLLAAIRLAASPAPVIDPPAPVLGETASATAQPVAPPDDAPPCTVTYIDPWGRWHCGAAGVVAAPVSQVEMPGPCTTVGMWRDRAVCNDLITVDGYPAPEGYPAP